MPVSSSGTLRTARDRLGSVDLWVDIGPAAVFLTLIWLKASYFNFPPREVVATDWNGWRPLEAVQAALATLSMLTVMLVPTLLLGRLARYAVLWLANLVISVVVLANVLHFRFYHDVVSVVSIFAAGQVGSVLGSVLALVRPTDVLLVADLLLAVAYLPWYRAAVRAAPPLPVGTRRRLALRGAAVAVVLLLAVPVRIVALDRGETFRYNYFRLFGVRKIGLINYHFYEAGRKSLDELTRFSIDPEERERALGYLDQWGDTATAPSELFGVARGRNLIILVVESLHRFPLELQIDGKPVMPNLAALAKRSMDFRNFYSQAWQGTSADGEFTALQSLHPLSAGAVQTRYPANHFRALPRILSDRGYTTLSSHGYYGDLWRSRDVHPRFGFDRSLFLENLQPGELIVGALSDGEFVRQLLPEVERLPRPFMAFLMTMSTHHPYDIPARYRTLRVGELQGTMLGDYLQAIHYFDGVLGDLVKRLEASGLMDESVLVIYGDHGAKLGDPRDLATLLTKWGGYPAPEPGLDARYWRVENQVPLIVHLPGDTLAGERSVSGGHLDIAPTLLGLLGIEGHEMVTLGRDLGQGHHSFVVLRNGGFVVADTVCLPPSASAEQSLCADMRANRQLDSRRFADRFRRAGERLRISDLVIRGDLIPRR